jgi:hypothetical protein
MVSLSKSDPVLLRPEEGTLEADFQGSVKKYVIRDTKVMLLCIQISDVFVNSTFAEVSERHRCRV